MENLLSQWNISEDEKIIFRNEGLVLKKGRWETCFNKSKY